MNICKPKILLRSPPRMVDVRQTIKNALAYVAFTPALRGKLLQAQTERVIQLFKER